MDEIDDNNRTPRRGSAVYISRFDDSERLLSLALEATNVSPNNLESPIPSNRQGSASQSAAVSAVVTPMASRSIRSDGGDELTKTISRGGDDDDPTFVDLLNEVESLTTQLDEERIRRYDAEARVVAFKTELQNAMKKMRAQNEFMEVKYQRDAERLHDAQIETSIQQMQAIHNDVSLVEEQRKTVSKLQKQLDDAKTMIKQLEDELDEKDRTYQMEQLRNSWLIFYNIALPIKSTQYPTVNLRMQDIYERALKEQVPAYDYPAFIISAFEQSMEESRTLAEQSTAEAPVSPPPTSNPSPDVDDTSPRSTFKWMSKKKSRTLEA